MEIARALYDQMVQHAQAEAPNECCGMISARDGALVAVHPMRNAAASPLRYEMDPREQYEVEYGQIYDAGLDVGVVYHSHTRSAPYPSQTDINLANHPDSVYVIVGLKDGVDVRGYTIRDQRVAEVELTIV
jgi:proteasome lid subunit RPN8/RPN11